MYRRDLRKEMLTMSFVVAPMGPLSEFFYLRDYWQPELFNGWSIGIEDLIFGFKEFKSRVDPSSVQKHRKGKRT
ncbi:MAG: hypothetical protein UT16_C0022G0002 [Candidatus Azambacteria bacterium GW2011_GWA2_39_10]|uniref:Uncharacterized protein n=1 Tax=Candidatus Azambacteria bacterium GW2011_GWA2_39_10 TaxID=1618611 RepID=A0A0G0NZA5_9BACT|nr:MAG: hypothetical protein UT16_C0022G0002 [Candidatus Azambacteria bacterium GW2011_GWA2_39_10]